MLPEGYEALHAEVGYYSLYNLYARLLGQNPDFMGKAKFLGKAANSSVELSNEPDPQPLTVGLPQVSTASKLQLLIEAD